MSHYQVDQIKVLVAISGNVDSLVTAFLLKKQGFQVLALAIQTWDFDDKRNEGIKAPKCAVSNLNELKKFCESLDIPFYATDLKAKFHEEVLEIAIADKIVGSANRSCLSCHSLRLRVLFEKMKFLKCHFIATGHYAKTYKNHQTQEYFIHASNETEFDQSFILSGLKQEILKKILFPLSELKREEVIKIAENFSLGKQTSGHNRLDCFEGDEGVAAKIEKTVPPAMRERGTAVQMPGSTFLGDQPGIFHFYLGQEGAKLGGKAVERGLIVSGFSYYEKTVHFSKLEEAKYYGAQLLNLNLTSEVDRTEPLNIYAKFKNQNKYVSCVIYFKNNNSAYIQFNEPCFLLLENEKVTFYEKPQVGGRVLGCGQIGSLGVYRPIDRTEDFKSHDKQADVEENDKTKIEQRF
ncbi:MAG: hypothetical protein JNM93_05890 [Bacteriovoracaceae bacterium]|nr:hypothetical protein [Bacteriovoracaceae bacterium]